MNLRRRTGRNRASRVDTGCTTSVVPLVVVVAVSFAEVDPYHLSDRRRRAEDRDIRVAVGADRNRGRSRQPGRNGRPAAVPPDAEKLAGRAGEQAAQTARVLEDVKVAVPIEGEVDDEREARAVDLRRTARRDAPDIGLTRKERDAGQLAHVVR